MKINLIDADAMNLMLLHEESENMRKEKNKSFVKGCMLASAVYVLWILLGYLGGIL